MGFFKINGFLSWKPQTVAQAARATCSWWPSTLPTTVKSRSRYYEIKLPQKPSTRQILQPPMNLNTPKTQQAEVQKKRDNSWMCWLKYAQKVCCLFGLKKPQKHHRFLGCFLLKEPQRHHGAQRVSEFWVQSERRRFWASVLKEPHNNHRFFGFFCVGMSLFLDLSPRASSS